MSGVDVDCGAGASQTKRKAVIRKDSAETHDYVCCLDMEVDIDKGLEEMGFVPRAVGEPLRVKHMCDKMCNETGFRFFF